MPEKIKVRAIIVATGLWSRRKLRRNKDVVFFDGAARALEEDLMLGEDWTELTFRGDRIRARVTAPPLAVLHKPVDSITSRKSDTGSPTVFEYLDPRIVDDVQPVGRLDRETHGVLLFTADGQLLHRLTHPKRKVLRTYVANVSPALTETGRQTLLNGDVELNDGHVPTPAFVDLEDGGTVVRLGLTEGKYHEVRRMLAAVDAPVIELRRVDYAGVTVDGLKAGESRQIDGVELERIYELVGLDQPDPMLQVEVVDG
jgi:pseudouridine synthase